MEITTGRDERLGWLLLMNAASPVSIVTGASRGIGWAVAERLARMGHCVIGLARRPPDASFPGEFLAVDLSDPRQTADVGRRIAGDRIVRCLVNNVGVSRAETIEAVDVDTLRTVLDLNLRPAIQLVQAFLPMMKKQAFGRVVNVTSLVPVGLPNRTSYAAAKAGLNGLTRVWARELAGTGITVNAVAPGPTDTALFRANNPPGSPSEQRFLQAVPMGRLAKPDEIAAAVAFFVSEEASFITGQILYVDGGASLGAAGRDQ